MYIIYTDIQKIHLLFSLTGASSNPLFPPEAATAPTPTTSPSRPASPSSPTLTTTPPEPMTAVTKAASLNVCCVCVRARVRACVRACVCVCIRRIKNTKILQTHILEYVLLCGDFVLLRELGN